MSRRRSVIRILTAVVGLLLSAAAVAQQCTYEVEPNDTPAQATLLSGLGPDATVAASQNRVGIACLAGEIAGQDQQDAFRWVVDEAAAQQLWKIELEGPHGGLTQLDLFDVEFAENGTDVVRADALLRVGSTNGTQASSDGFIVGPGEYVLGLSMASASGDYVANLVPTPLRDLSRAHQPGLVANGEFDYFTSLSSESSVELTIDEEASGFVWSLSLQVPLGADAELVVSGQSGELARLEARDGGRVSLDNLGLDAGTYQVNVVPGSVPGGSFARFAVARLGRASGGTEIEPNDSAATATLFPLASRMQGVAEGQDNFVIPVSADQAGSSWDLTLEASAEIRLRFYGPDGTLLQDRRGVSGVSPGLTLVEGAYRLVVEGRDGANYELELASAEPPAPGFEHEPNDTVGGATPLGESAQARGELTLTDIDNFRLDVTGEAQIYRVQVVGRGVERLELLNAAGQGQTEARGDGRLRLDDLVLIPGPHYLRVTGSPGEYAIRALSLGPAPEQAPQAEAPRHDEPLSGPSSAAAAEQPLDSSEQPLEEALADPAAATLPQLPPPPPGVLEAEPNNDYSRSQRLFLDNVHVGRLPDGNDVDSYRFFLANDQYMRFELKPDVEDSGWAIAIDGEYLNPLAPTADGTLVIERWLLAGDHRLELAGRWLDEPSEGYYQLRVSSLGTLGLPIDLEPNDSPQQASTLPVGLAWQGFVGYPRGDDVYALPSFPSDTSMRLEIVADERIEYWIRADGDVIYFEETEQGPALTLPASAESNLYFRGMGAYDVKLAFDAPLPADTVLRPAPGEGLELSLTLDNEEATAFWHQGQRLAGSLSLTNSLDTPAEVDLSGAASDFAVDVQLPASVQVGAGETAIVPVEVALPDDMREDLPLVIQVQASTQGAAGSAGATGIGSTRLGLRCEAPPIGAFSYWSLPSTLLGRPNVLFAGHGAVLEPGIEPYHRHALLLDGRVAVSIGGYIDDERTPTFVLAGDGPATLVGTVLNPLSDASTVDQLRRFRIEASLDGESFEPVFEGELSAVRQDQAFVFDEPVDARFARLVALESFSGRAAGYLGEWMLIAEDPTLFSQANLALPSLGGHLARSTPYLSGGDAHDMLAGVGTGRSLDMRQHEAMELVVGFHHNRAAKVDGFTWQQGNADATLLYDLVEVSVSTTGAAGPWTVVGQWPLTRSANAPTAVEFDEPVWARYVKFETPRPDDFQRSLSAPAGLAIHESAATDTETGYRSIMAAWGTGSNKGPYELLNPVEQGPISDDEAPNETADQATPLPSDTLIVGTVAVAEDVDWYRFTVPDGENHFELRLSGDPAIGYIHELTHASGEPVDAQVVGVGNDLVLSAYVEPGDYLLKLEEPKRTVVFAWDTSGSVAPYQPITYASLAAFARGVNGDREAVQLMAYDSPVPKWLLPIWSDDPLRVQQALSSFDRNADSSDSELSLLTATRALADRPGTTAVLLITDAESGGASLSPDLWQALEEVGPRVFTFEVSSGGSDYAQDLMQDWAASNAGVYQMAQGVGSFEAGFDRASCLLRRPKRYGVIVETAYVAPPGPGTLSVMQAPGAAQGAVEVIFDASGSMGQQLPSGEQRIVAAKRALETLVGEVLPDETPFALRAFGHIAPSSCETNLDVALAPLEREAALSAVRAIEPKLLSQTPLADSLAAAVGDLSSASGPRTVILITDGEESCGGDPTAAAEALKASAPVALSIVSLALDAEGLATFETLAEAIGASYIDVGSYEALAAAITEALVPAFEVYDHLGELVATGRVGDTVELPMGTYRVNVLSSPVEVFESVRVPGDGAVEVAAGRP